MDFGLILTVSHVVLSYMPPTARCVGSAAAAIACLFRFANRCCAQFHVSRVVALLMSAVFYIAFVGGGRTVATARAEGWVFSTDQAKSQNWTGTAADGGGSHGEPQTKALLRFVNVWTMRDFNKVSWSCWARAVS